MQNNQEEHSSGSSAGSGSNISKLVLSGGGNLLGAHSGALIALSEKWSGLDQINEWFGTSAGALIGLLAVIGYDARDIARLSVNFQYLSYGDPSIINLCQYYGLESGQKLVLLIRELLVGKGFEPDITFAGLEEQTKKKFTVTVVQLRSSGPGKIIYCNSANTPDWIVSDLVLASMSVPFMFAPLRIENKLYVDGGLLDNFPLEYAGLDRSLGLVINPIWREEEDSGEGINEFNSYSMAIFRTLIRTQRPAGEGAKIVEIVLPEQFKFTDFNMSVEMKSRLVSYGYMAVINQWDLLFPAKKDDEKK